MSDNKFERLMAHIDEDLRLAKADAEAKQRNVDFSHRDDLEQNTRTLRNAYRHRDTLQRVHNLGEAIRRNR